MHGWLPVTVQVIAAVALIAAVSRRSGRWQLRWLPWALIVGCALAASAYWYVASQGLSDNPAPNALWIWIGLTGFAAAVLVSGWRRARWWRRGVTVMALPLSLLCAALALNLWVGYFPTVQTAWNQLTAGPLPDQTDEVTVMAMQHERKIPPKGTVVSGRHQRRGFGFPAPRRARLSAAGLVRHQPGAEAADGDDDRRRVQHAGRLAAHRRAVKMLDDFAAAHHGNAPVVVFVDPGGAFNNDTECVNGSRGNSADHLTKDVVPYMVSNFGVSPDRAKWGIVGWSMGGTCAVDLAVMHPDMFSAFEDIAGDIGPNSGTKDQTIARLFGGNADAWAAFDPDDGHHQARPLHGGGRMVRRQRLDRDDPARQERPGRSRELVVRVGRCQRNRLRGGQPAG